MASNVSRHKIQRIIQFMKYNFLLKTPSLLAILFLIWLIFCLPWFYDGLIIPYDAKNHFYAMIRFFASSLHEGKSPLWSPYHYGGFPMASDPQSVLFTPTLWLPAFFSNAPSAHLVDFIHLLHLLVIGFATFLFAKSRGWHPLVALITAETLMLGGALTMRLEHVLMTVSMMWLSLALWRLDAAIRLGGWWRGVLFGLFLGLLLIDRNHVAYLAAWFLFGYWLCAALPVSLKQMPFEILKKQWPILLGGTFSLLLASIPILLLLQLAENSNRPDFSLKDAGWQSLHPVSLISFILPDFLGSLHMRGDYWGPASFQWAQNHPEEGKLQVHRSMLNFYMGTLPVLIIFWFGLFKGVIWSQNTRYFLITMLIFLIYSLGRYTPAFAVFYELIPGVDLFRRPADGLFLFGFSIALFTGATLDGIIKTNRPKWGETLYHSKKILFFLLVGITLYSTITFSIEQEKTSYLFFSLLVFSFFGLTLWGLMKLAVKYENLQVLMLTFLAFIVAADLIQHRSGLLSNARPADFYQAQITPDNEKLFARLTKLLEETDKSGAPWRIETLGLGPAVQNIAQVTGYHNLLGYNPIRLKHFAELIGPDMQNNAANRRHFGRLMTHYDSDFTNELGVKYIVTGKPINEIDSKTPKGRFQLLEIIPYLHYKAHIYVNHRAEERAILVHEKAGNRTSHVKITHYERDKITLSVETEDKARLVLRDFVYPGWQVFVNGERREIINTKGLFRSVFLDQGKHEVVFIFKPFSFENLQNAAFAILKR